MAGNRGYEDRLLRDEDLFDVIRVIDEKARHIQKAGADNIAEFPRTSGCEAERIVLIFAHYAGDQARFWAGWDG